MMCLFLLFLGDYNEDFITKLLGEIVVLDILWLIFYSGVE
jgi:hypothetical protein